MLASGGRALVNGTLENSATGADMSLVTGEGMPQAFGPSDANYACGIITGAPGGAAEFRACPALQSHCHSFVGHGFRYALDRGRHPGRLLTAGHAKRPAPDLCEEIMSGVALIISFALGVGLSALGVLILALSTGQYEDLDGDSERILLDDPD